MTRVSMVGGQGNLQQSVCRIMLYWCPCAAPGMLALMHFAVCRLGLPVRLPGRASAHIDGGPRRDSGPARMGGCPLDLAGVPGLFPQLPGRPAVEANTGSL